MSDSAFSLRHVGLAFGPVEVLRDLTLEIVRGEFVAVVGPSGCGKTTLLNVLSGYARPTSGSVTCQGRARMVYQQDSLLPWLTVEQNVAMGLRQVQDTARRQQETREMLELVHLNGFAEHYPHQISGGMRQRVELARALAGESDTLLLDEPFSSLDYLSRLRLRGELARLLRERPRTVVLVTHDIEEAAQLADRVVVLTARPAAIRNELNLTTPRPRVPTQPDVVAAVATILDQMHLEAATDEEESGVSLSV